MYFDSLQAALAMDGHGIFVWAAYAVTATVVALLLIAPYRRRRRLLRRIAGDVKRKQSAAVHDGHMMDNSGQR